MNGISIGKLPRKGLVLAYFPDRLVFSTYCVKGEELLTQEKELFEKVCPDECHFFDHDTEYRLVQRRSRGEVIELVLTADEEEGTDPDLLFTEDVLVSKEYTETGMPEKLQVTSRYRYSDNDTLILDMYRISTVD